MGLLPPASTLGLNFGPWRWFAPRCHRQAAGLLKQIKARWFGLFHFLAANPDAFRIAPKTERSADSAEYEVTLLQED